MLISEFTKVVKTFPITFGCYIFWGNDVPLYIGKANNLQKRVLGYLHRSHNFRLTKLFAKTTKLTFIKCQNTREALILEQNLINKYLPYFNMVNIDDKRYPYLIVTRETAPKFKIVRKIPKKGKYLFIYGPFPDGTGARDIMQILNFLFPLRKCRALPKNSCIYYSMKMCLAPCIHTISDETNQKIIHDVKQFFKNNFAIFIRKLLRERRECIQKMNFERAELLTKYIDKLKFLQQKQNVIFLNQENYDVIGVVSNKDNVCITIFYYRSGKLLSHIAKIIPFIHKNFWNEVDFFLYSHLQNQFVADTAITTSQIAKNCLTINLLYKKVTIPQKGKKYIVLQDVLAAASNNLANNINVFLHKNDIYEKAISQLIKITNIKSAISTIDMIDCSHSFGENYCSAIVSTINGRFQPSRFRLYKLDKYLNRANDTYGILQTIKHFYSQKKRICDLLLIDGGIAQYNVAVTTINQIQQDCAIIAVAKNSAHQTSHLIYNGQPIKFNLQSQELKLFLTNFQDRTHQFVINYFRRRQEKVFLQ